MDVTIYVLRITSFDKKYTVAERCKESTRKALRDSFSLTSIIRQLTISMSENYTVTWQVLFHVRFYDFVYARMHSH